jgi:hypothetical protein
MFGRNNQSLYESKKVSLYLQFLISFSRKLERSRGGVVGCWIFNVSRAFLLRPKVFFIFLRGRTRSARDRG